MIAAASCRIKAHTKNLPLFPADNLSLGYFCFRVVPRWSAIGAHRRADCVGGPSRVEPRT